MDNEYDIDALLERQSEIASEIERLMTEKDELDVAVRVLRRFSVSANAKGSKLGPSRPENAPTLFEMTETVVRAAEARGKNGLTGREIVEEIGREFWAGVQPPQILPSIYQFAKKGRLKKSNGRFRTIEIADADTR